MQTHIDKKQENNNLAVANNSPRLQSNIPVVAQFTDNRPETMARKELNEMAKNSSQVKQLLAIRKIANDRTGQVNELTIQNKKNETGLPENLKSGVESISGISLDNVRVHYNSSQPAQLNALAYAQGADIHIAPGQEKHLPHEAWHVVQQAQGRVKPTMQLKEGIPVNDDKGLENEADIMGARALSNPLQMVSKEDEELLK
jgi:hypothetical protein